jgi:hypothetical protein
MQQELVREFLENIHHSVKQLTETGVEWRVQVGAFGSTILAALFFPIRDIVSIIDTKSPLTTLPNIWILAVGAGSKWQKVLIAPEFLDV